MADDSVQARKEQVEAFIDSLDESGIQETTLRDITVAQGSNGHKLLLKKATFTRVDGALLVGYNIQTSDGGNSTRLACNGKTFEEFKRDLKAYLGAWAEEQPYSVELKPTSKLGQRHRR